jgi:hypothetical protein
MELVISLASRLRTVKSVTHSKPRTSEIVLNERSKYFNLEARPRFMVLEKMMRVRLRIFNLMGAYLDM